MKTIDRDRRKFHYPKEHGDYYETYITEGKGESLANKEKKIFVNKKDIFILSAILGYKYKKKETFKEKIAFTADFGEYAGIIYSIALTETRNPLVLKNENNEFKKNYIEDLIEQYACGGFEILRKKLETKGKTPLELIEELLEKEMEEDEDIDLVALGPIL